MVSLYRRAPLAVLAVSLASAPVSAAPVVPPAPPAPLQGAPPVGNPDPAASAADPAADPADDAARDFAGPTEIPAVEPTAQELYAEGERAYFVGDYVTAVARFEAAYAKSRLPQLLYNVGLAYMRRYELSKDIADLRRAQSVLTNFRVELERDPTIGSAQNVESLLAQIVRSIAAHRDVRKDAVPAPNSAVAATQPDSCPEPLPPRTIIKQADTRRAGAALLAVGGLSLAAGVASGLGFALKGRQFRSDLATFTAMQDAACASSESANCVALSESVAITKANGHTANILAGTLGGGLTALGVAGLVAGSVLYTRQAKQDRRARIQAGPSIGGVWLRGAF
jgi:hypothetical protein